MRFVTIGFYIFCFMLSLSLMHEINVCYEFGNLVASCPDETPKYRPFMPVEINPIMGTTFLDANGNPVNSSSLASMNTTLADVASYDEAPTGLSDVFGFFSWVVTGGRMLVNAFIMPLYGFPGFLQQFWIPQFVTYFIGAALALIQVVGLYEYFSGREMFKRQ